MKGGNIFTSHDYDCRSCGKTANPDKSPATGKPEPSPEHDLIFKKGHVKSE